MKPGYCSLASQFASSTGLGMTVYRLYLTSVSSAVLNAGGAVCPRPAATFQGLVIRPSPLVSSIGLCGCRIRHIVAVGGL